MDLKRRNRRGGVLLTIVECSLGGGLALFSGLPMPTEFERLDFEAVSLEVCRGSRLV